MTYPKKKSILDRIRDGELTLPTESEVKSDPRYSASIEATIDLVEQAGDTDLVSPRLPGRPSKIRPRRLTEVRSLRLEKSLWGYLERQSYEIGCSVNRYIEESILSRLGLLDEETAPPELVWAGDYRINRRNLNPGTSYKPCTYIADAVA